MVWPIKYDRSVIPACDMSDLTTFEKIVAETCDMEGIGGYKVGLLLIYKNSLPKVVETIRKYTNEKVIIVDGQKLATDIPDLGEDFAKLLEECKADAVIFFPQSGPETEKAWITAAMKRNLGVIVGGEMTHKKFKRSEGGYIADEVLDDIYLNAAELGVTNFVVPGNKVDRVTHYKKLLETVLKPQGKKLTLFAPGLIAQGGVISETGKAAGDNFHGIVGRGIYAAPNIKAAALEHVSQIVKK